VTECELTDVVGADLRVTCKATQGTVTIMATAVLRPCDEAGTAPADPACPRDSSLWLTRTRRPARREDTERPPTRKDGGACR
jgi:hypothetical protein